MSDFSITGNGDGVYARRVSSHRKRTTVRRSKAARHHSHAKRARSYPRTYRHSSHIHVTKRTSHRKIHYTKYGQPYIIKPNGMARFITKRGAKSSKHRKGGRY
jgi:hypothetical protein